MGVRQALAQTGAHWTASRACLLLLLLLKHHAESQGPADAGPVWPAGAGRDDAAVAPAPAGLPAAWRPAQRAKQAYASLLYGDSFLLGMRVLGQSLRETGTGRDLVALVTRDVSERAADTLASDGWKVQRVDMIDNPGRWTQSTSQTVPPRFRGVYTKLLLWNLTQYERVVYMDADTLAVRPLDDLFLCDGLCGVMRHSERINSGVLVLTPSSSLLQDMLAAAATTPSYTGGDQGFINAYFADFASAPLFDPRRGQLLSEASGWRSARAHLPLGRLPTLYNADLGLFVMNSNRWTSTPAEIRVLHYTLADFKPWDWWAGWLMGVSASRWQELRARLPPSPEGRTHGRTSQQQLARTLLLPLPPLLAALLLARCCMRQQGPAACLQSLRLHWRRATSAPPTLLPATTATAGGRPGARPGIRNGNGSGMGSPNGSTAGPALRPLPSKAADVQQLLASVDGVVGLGSLPVGGAVLCSTPVPQMPAWLPMAAAVAGMAAVLAALAGSVFLLIPRQIEPSLGWLLAYEWTAASFALLFSAFLQACRWLGRRSCAAAAGTAVPGGTRRLWGPTCLLLAAVVATVGLVPWWADLLGVRTFVGKALATIAAGLLSVSVCSQCFAALATLWYACGVKEGPAPAGVHHRMRAECKEEA